MSESKDIGRGDRVRTLAANYIGTNLREGLEGTVSAVYGSVATVDFDHGTWNLHTDRLEVIR